MGSLYPSPYPIPNRSLMYQSTYQEMTEDQKAITEMVRQFVDEQILPNAEEYDHEDKFPEPIVEQMKELGLFGVTLPEQ
jgi:alkylation response protein AidB-like acyl-CoA dehydrogenase